MLISLAILALNGSLFENLTQIRLTDSLWAAGVPGLLYALQGVLIQTAYRHLDYLSFNLLNQTKLLSTAIFNYVILR